MPPLRHVNLTDVITKLDTVYDESDPDNSLPQSIHAYQTANYLENILQKIL